MKDAFETMCVTMWCICYVASMSIKQLSYIFCYYLHGNTAVIATTVATLLQVSGYYTGVFSFVSLGSKAITVVECVQFQEEYT